MGRTPVLPIDGVFVERCICSLLIKDLIRCDSGASATPQLKSWMDSTKTYIPSRTFSCQRNIGATIIKNQSLCRALPFSVVCLDVVHNLEACRSLLAIQVNNLCINLQRVTIEHEIVDKLHDNIALIE